MANEKEPPVRKNRDTDEISTKRDSVKETPAAPPPVARRESLTKEPRHPINVTLPGPRKSVTEIIKEDIPRIENLPEESVTVRRPSRMETVPSTPPVDVKVEETFKLPPKAKEPSPPPPKEPTPPPPAKEPTPPPREPTPPPPKEPTPPPREPTPPPPPKEPTPEPEEPKVVDEPVIEVAEVAVVNKELAPEPALADEASVSVGEAQGSEAEEGSNKGELEDLQLDEDEGAGVPQDDDEVCDDDEEQADLEIDDDDDNGPG
jgi:hypothetical protein